MIENIKTKINNFLANKLKQKKNTNKVIDILNANTEAEKKLAEIENKNKIAIKNAFIDKIKNLSKHENFDLFIERFLLQKLQDIQQEIIVSPAEKLIHYQGKLSAINEILNDIYFYVNAEHEIYVKNKSESKYNELKTNFEENSVKVVSQNLKKYKI